jgi:pilus assembly protein TadC
MNSRIGRLEGEMNNVERNLDDLKDDFKATKEIVTQNAISISNLTITVRNYIESKTKEERDKEKELSRWEIVFVSAGLSMLSGIVIGIILYVVK